LDKIFAKIHDVQKKVKRTNINLAALENFAKRGILENPQKDQRHKRNKSLDMMSTEYPRLEWDFGASIEMVEYLHQDITTMNQGPKTLKEAYWKTCLQD
jgi:hypothetical protein